MDGCRRVSVLDHLLDGLHPVDQGVIRHLCVPAVACVGSSDHPELAKRAKRLIDYMAAALRARVAFERELIALAAQGDLFAMDVVCRAAVAAVSARWIYVSGPLTQGDTIGHVRRAIETGLALRDAGLVPVVPHLSVLSELVSARPYDYWLEYDVALLSRCDALLRLPGESRGAEIEVAHARERGIPVFLSLAGAIAWATAMDEVTQ